MTSARDRNGNVITFNEAGIFFGGESIVSISRDSSGRVVSIQDLSGTQLTYAYQRGRLIGFKDGEGYTSSYRYDSNGRLNELIDPMNRPFAKTTYDAQGRMTSTTNRDGRVIHYGHSPTNQQQIIEDANGAITVLEFDSQGNLVRETDALGGVTEREFDSSGNQTLTRDPLGREIRRAFDAVGRVISGVDASGATTVFTYDIQGNLLSETSPLGVTVRYEYDARGNLIKKIESDGTISIRRTNDERGNVTEESNALGERTIQEFDSLGRPVAIIDPLGNRVELQRGADGVPTERIDALGNRTHFTVDRRGLITAIRGPDGKTVNREFNPIGENTAASNGHGSPIQYEVNADGRETLFTDALGNARERIYDLAGNLISVVDPYGRVTNHEYDALGRRIKTIHPDGSFISIKYDAVGNLVEQTDELGFKTRFDYDTSDRPVRTVDPLGRITTQQYDLLGRLVAVSDPAGRITRYIYDNRDNLIETQFPDGTRRILVYDKLDRLVEQIAPDGTRTRREYDQSGRMTAVIASDGSRMTYVYDKNNRMIAQIDPMGRETNFAYNVYGQITQRRFPDGATENTIYDQNGFIDRIVRTDGQLTEQDYDPNGKLIRQRLADGTEEIFTYSPTGKLLSAGGASGTTSFQYDSRDRLVRVTQPSGVMVLYEYDAVGNRIAVIIDRQGIRTTTTYAYDGLGRLSSATAPSGEIHRYIYDPSGNVSQIRFANGITEDRLYDSMNRPTEIRSSHSGQTIEQLQYTYTLSGLRESVMRLDGTRVAYHYDSRHRLVSEIHYNAANGIDWQESYEHDAVGNRVAVTRNGQRIVQTFNALDQLITSGQDTFTYDSRGRMVQRTGPNGPIQFAYDSEDQLVRVTKAGIDTVYAYDALGNRIRSTSNNKETEHVLDLNSPTGVSQVLEDHALSSVDSAQYVFGVSGRELMRSSDGAQTFHYDANGNVRRLHDEQGDTVVQYLTSAFGTLIGTAGSSPNTFRFTGERTDESLGLVHLRARDYMVDAGQFLTRDPYEGTTDDPTSLHRYLYAHQNPVTNRDPTGEATLAEQAMIGGLINGLVSVGTSYLGGNRNGGRLFFDFIVGAGFGAISGGLGGTVAKALTNDFMRTAVFANAASTSLFVKYSPRLVYAIPNTFFGVAEDITKGFGNGDMQKPGFAINVIANATVNFVYNVIVGPANIDAYEIQRSIPKGAGYWVEDIGQNFYKILTDAERKKMGVLKEIVVEFGETSFSKGEEYFFQFMSEATKFIAGAAISRANEKN
jgi:RHS repeat-associated protein